MANESQNTKGEFALYENGKVIGYSNTTIVDGVRVVDRYLPYLNALKNAAKKDKIELSLVAGFRTWSEQFEIRKKNVIDKSKINDNKYLCTANNGLFYPRTGMPGYSNHQSGDAYDFKNCVSVDPSVKVTPEYNWLAHNAIQYGFIRTVPSERWHWQYLPKMGKFSFVHQDDPTWDGLV